jgi:hypothetical protein
MKHHQDVAVAIREENLFRRPMENKVVQKLVESIVEIAD